MGRIDRDDLADDEPVEQYADCGEALLYDRLLKILAKRAHIGATCNGSVATSCA